MVRLTKINHHDVVVNSDLIEHIETTPDTVITLTTGQKLMVLESPDEIIALVVAFRRRIGHDLTNPSDNEPAEVSSPGGALAEPLCANRPQPDSGPVDS